MKIMYWYKFSMGSAIILIGVFFFSGVQLFFTGLVGEHIISMNT